jgi:hypothetical protein
VFGHRVSYRHFRYFQGTPAHAARYCGDLNVFGSIPTSTMIVAATEACIGDRLPGHELRPIWLEVLRRPSCRWRLCRLRGVEPTKARFKRKRSCSPSEPGHPAAQVPAPTGGRWPGGWWFATEAEVEYETHQIYLQDVAGWRRDRVPERPSGRPIRIRPDWTCELLSPFNAKRDLVDKFKVLQMNGSRTTEQTLIVHRWQSQGYFVVLTAAAGEIVRAEPFDALELRVSGSKMTTSSRRSHGLRRRNLDI